MITGKTQKLVMSVMAEKKRSDTLTVIETEDGKPLFLTPCTFFLFREGDKYRIDAAPETQVDKARAVMYICLQTDITNLSRLKVFS